MCVCVYVFIYLNIYLFICVFIYLFIHFYIYSYLYSSLSIAFSKSSAELYIYLFNYCFLVFYLLCVCLYICMCPKKSSHAAMSRGNLNWPNVQLNVAICRLHPHNNADQALSLQGSKSPSPELQSIAETRCSILWCPGQMPRLGFKMIPGLVMTNSSPWDFDGPNRNRWFTCLPIKNGGSFHGYLK